MSLARWGRDRVALAVVPRLAFAFQTLDDLHLLARPLRLLQPRVEQRQIVVRLRIFGTQSCARFERGLRARVILQLQIERAERDMDVTERRREFERLLE